ncbi:hypothetical protein ACFY7Y_37970 [Streptomyces virginiae]
MGNGNKVFLHDDENMFWSRFLMDNEAAEAWPSPGTGCCCAT